MNRHLRSHHLSAPLRFPLSLLFFCPLVKNEARNCCDVLRNCFLKTMLRNCCAISLYQRIPAGNSITAAADSSKTHMLKRYAAGKKNAPWIVEVATKRECAAILSEK